MKTIILCAVSAAVSAWFVSMQYENEGLRSQYDTGYKNGWKAALYKRPVHEELELVCAGLWFGRENQKYQERQNASK